MHATHGHLASSKTFPSFATLLVADEKPTQAQRGIGATRNYKLIFCWKMEAITNYFYGNNSTQEIRRVGMNKIGTAHVLLSDSIHTLPIEVENNGRGGLYESWLSTGVSSLAMTVVLLCLASASEKQIRDRGRRCQGRGSVYNNGGGPAPVRRTRLSMRQMRYGGRVLWISLFCGGDRKWGVFRCTTLGAGLGLAG